MSWDYPTSGVKYPEMMGAGKKIKYGLDKSVTRKLRWSAKVSLKGGFQLRPTRRKSISRRGNPRSKGLGHR